MPLFPGERALSQTEVLDSRFATDAAPNLQRPNGSEVWFGVVPTAQASFFIARLYDPHLRRPDPDHWWLFDEDVDETEGWREMATFTAEGMIAYGEDGNHVRFDDEPLGATLPVANHSAVLDAVRPPAPGEVRPAKSVWAHLQDNLAEVQAAKSASTPQKSVWDHLPKPKQ